MTQPPVSGEQPATAFCRVHAQGLRVGVPAGDCSRLVLAVMDVDAVALAAELALPLRVVAKDAEAEVEGRLEPAADRLADGDRSGLSLASGDRMGLALATGLPERERGATLVEEGVRAASPLALGIGVAVPVGGRVRLKLFLRVMERVMDSVGVGRLTVLLCVGVRVNTGLRGTVFEGVTPFLDGLGFSDRSDWAITGAVSQASRSAAT